MTTPTPDSIIGDIASALAIDPTMIRSDDDLLDLGMDSIRIMSLIEKWRASGITVDYADLAEDTLLNSWLAVVIPSA